MGKSGWETESGTNSCRKCPNAKKGLPAGQTGNNNQKCFRSVPREAAFLRLAIFGINLSRIPFPIPISFFHFFFIYKRRVGIGEGWHEVDSYLLDNRNRTQKWDE